MKKIILILIFVISNLPIYAQLEKKTWLLGGSGSFSSTVSTVTYTNNVDPITLNAYFEKSKVFNLNLSPSIGYFLLDKFALGLKPTITWEKSQGVDGTNGVSLIPNKNSRNFLIGPFFRYYFLKKEKPFNFLIESTYQFGMVRVFDNIKGNTNNLSILAGTSLYFNKTIALEFLLGYNRFFRTTRIESAGVEYPSYTQSILQKGLQFNIGLQFHLEKK